MISLAFIFLLTLCNANCSGIVTDNEQLIQECNVGDNWSDPPKYWLKPEETQECTHFVEYIPPITPSSNPSNVMFEGFPDINENATTVYRFYCHPECFVTAGFTNNNLFKPGWGADGIFVTSGGNLAGRGLYVSNFLTQSRYLDLIVEPFDTFKVYVATEEKFFGLAYNLTNSHVMKSLRPFIQLSEDFQGSKVGVKSWKADGRLSNRPWASPSPRDPAFSGSWVAYSMDDAATVATLNIIPNQRTETDDVLATLALQVVNTATTSGRFGVFDATHGSVSVNPIAAQTRMLALPQSEVFENQMFQFLVNLTTWEIHDSNLVLRAKNDDAAMFAPFYLSPVDINPFATPDEQIIMFES